MQPGSFLELPVAAFLDRLASNAPTPGGGAVAALVGATAAALGRMACAFTLGNPRFVEVQSRVEALTLRLERSEALLRRLVDEDAAAYEALRAAFKILKSDPAREKRIQTAAETAAATPLETLTFARAVRGDLAALAPLANPNLRSDVEVGLHLAEAAMRAAAINVRVNLPLLSAEARERIDAQLEALTKAEKHAAAK